MGSRKTAGYCETTELIQESEDPKRRAQWYLQVTTPDSSFLSPDGQLQQRAMHRIVPSSLGFELYGAIVGRCHDLSQGGQLDWRIVV